MGARGRKSHNTIRPTNKRLPSQSAVSRTEPEGKTRGGRPQIPWFPIDRTKLAEAAENSEDWALPVYTSTATGRGKQAGQA